MHPDDKTRWEKVRKKGRLWYVTIHGALNPGTLVFAGTVIGAWSVSESNLTADYIFKRAGVCLAIGAVIGLAKWAWNENLYRSE